MEVSNVIEDINSDRALKSSFVLVDEPNRRDNRDRCRGRNTKILERISKRVKANRKGEQARQNITPLIYYIVLLLLLY